MKLNDEKMSDRELRERMSALNRKLDALQSEVSNKGHTFIIVALIVLLIRGCNP